MLSLDSVVKVPYDSKCAQPMEKRKEGAWKEHDLSFQMALKRPRDEDLKGLDLHIPSFKMRTHDGEEN